MHDGMLYDPIQGQGQGTSVFWSSENCTFPSLISSAIYNRSWQV